MSRDTSLRRVEILGGGPAGLFAAQLIKTSHPSCDVRVWERTVPDETFGFGVGITGRTLRAVADLDPASADALSKAGVAIPAQEIRVGTRSAISHSPVDAMAISRSSLLTILLEAARAAGVTVELGRERGIDELRDADLVVAADGVGSAVRERYATEFGASVSQGRGLFIWLGLASRLETNLFAPVFTEHGMFNIHGYPYAADRSTLGIETDLATFRSAGMERSTAQTPVDESDMHTLAFLGEAFRGVLPSGQLLGNRSRWMRFRTVSTRRWRHDNVVLIGDAAHTAHYSVGSGTKMALEDAIALGRALRSGGGPAALDAYERNRRPRVEALQELAVRSQWWWESLGTRVARLPPAQLMLAYLSRGGAVSAARLAEHDPDLLREGLTDFAGVSPRNGDGQDPARWALARPLEAGPWSAPTRHAPLSSGYLGDRRYLEVRSPEDLRDRRASDPNACLVVTIESDVADPWAGAADALIARCRDLHAAGATGVRLEGPGRRAALLDRLALAERVKHETGLLTVVAGPQALLDDLADGVIADRMDLIAVEPDPKGAP